MNNHYELNQQQYDDKAQNYLNSSIHATGQEFNKITNILQTKQIKSVLDLGCGGGHVSYHISPHVDQVVAYDLSHSMIEIVEKTAKSRNINNINIQQGRAEQLPFDNQKFDLVITRYSAHHWQDIHAAVKEVYRVLKDQGIFIIIDTIGSEHPILNTFLQTIEMIRDPSHACNYSISEWINILEKNHFHIEQVQKQNLNIVFSSWIERMNTLDNHAQTIRNLQNQVSQQVREYFDIQPDGSFRSDVGFMVVQK